MGVIVTLGNADPEKLRPPQGDLMWHSPVLMNFKPFFLTNTQGWWMKTEQKFQEFWQERNIDKWCWETHCDTSETQDSLSRPLVLELCPQSKLNGLFDEVTPVGKNTWTVNKDPDVKRLSRNCLEQNTLLLFDKAPMRFIRNLPDKGLSQRKPS